MTVMDKIGRPIVAPVAPADVEATIAVLALAFIADPVARWAYPDPEQYLRLFPAFVRRVRWSRFRAWNRTPRRGPRRGGAVAAAGYRARPRRNRGHSATRTRSRDWRCIRSDGVVSPARSALVSAADRRRSDPSTQRFRCGAAAGHARQCDSDHAVAYLESTNAANTALYRRHGFEVLGTIAGRSQSTPMFPMRREAR